MPGCLSITRSTPCASLGAAQTAKRSGVVTRFQAPKRQLSIHRQPDQPAKGVLGKVEEDLEEFCNLEAADPSACSQVREWYVHKVHDAEAHQALGQSVADADELQRLQQSLRELTAAGSMRDVFSSLLIMKRIEDKKAAERAAEQHPTSSSASVSLPESAKPNPSMGGLTSEDKELLTRLFKRMDSDGNGELTYDEFVNAMHMIGDDLNEEDQLLVGSVLDLQGHVTLDQFIAIVEEAEAQRLYHSSDAYFLRHACHVGEKSQLPGGL